MPTWLPKQADKRDIVRFRRQDEGSQSICFMPEISQNRKMTDVSFLIVFGVCATVLISFMIYALCNSDMQRLTHGYDRCGNVCGSKNKIVEGIPCSGVDMTNKPYLLYQRECVESCSGIPVTFHRCDDNPYLDSFGDLVNKLQQESSGLVILCLSGLGLTIVSVMLFRYFPTQFVWTMLIAGILLMFGFSGLFWYLFSESDSSTRNSFLAMGVVWTIFSAIFALCIWVLKPRITLIISFYKETVRILFAMPLILLEPALTFIANFVVLALFVYTFVLMSTSGTLQVDYGTIYAYVLNPAVTFTLCWSFVMMLWMVQFLLACQQMVIAGAVSTYFFTADRSNVASPIYTSVYNLIRYHLGTVAFGSFTITIITIIKMIIRAAADQNNWMRLIYYCLRPLEDLLKYLTSMGYIETAIHGQPLCRSSIRAVNLIVSNLLSAVAMNSIGNFVFLMAKLAVVALVVLIGVLMHLPAAIILFGGIVALLSVHIAFVMFETAVDTVFICYCEDQSINNGNDNPYLVPVELYNEIIKAQALTLRLEKKKLEKRSKNK